MSDVVKLERASVVWVCDCGCSSFYLREDGEAECCNCEGEVQGAEQGWFDRVKGKSARDENKDDPFTDVSGNGSVSFARARIQRIAGDEDIAAIIVVKDSGTSHAYSIAETGEELKWVEAQVNDAVELLKSSRE